MIVADTNLLVYLLIDGPLTPVAVRARAKDRIWAVPSLLLHEFLHVLSRQVARGNVHRDEAIRAYKRELSMVDVSDLQADPLAILNMVEQTKCSSYDLEYVWLAQELSVPLITADKEILQAYPGVATSIEAYAARSD